MHEGYGELVGIHDVVSEDVMEVRRHKNSWTRLATVYQVFEDATEETSSV